MASTEAIEQPVSAEQNYSLESPDLVIELINEPDFENMSDEKEEQKKPTVVVHRNSMKKNNKTTKRKKIKVNS
jgi:3-keto-L-gulonate-6-phosphate decarboxylase